MRLDWKTVTTTDGQQAGGGVNHAGHGARPWRDRLLGSEQTNVQNIGTEPGVLLFGVTPGGFEKMFAERQGVDAQTNENSMAKHHMQVVGPPLR